MNCSRFICHIRKLVIFAVISLPLTVNASDELVTAASDGDLNEVKALLDAGANINFVDQYSGWDRTALIAASRNGHVEVVRLLLKHKANPNLGDAGEMTALNRSVKKGHAEVVSLLLSNGADPEAFTDELGRSPLVWSVFFADGNDQSAQISIFSALIEHKAKCVEKLEIWDKTVVMKDKAKKAGDAFYAAYLKGCPDKTGS
ncbi:MULTISPECIES: ankyrin repeat domain-containing protein [Corallincola]|nr:MULTISPECIES: ankyrin repeat domain-containing protein [Corallincola]